MKLMISSDIHGSYYYCNKMVDVYNKENAKRLILLGDLLYHGPRNDLPKEYNPKQVIRILNDLKDDLICIRGNCDADVDQMVLEFPILAEYMIMFLNEHMVFATHGHVYNKQNLSKLKYKDILLNGHTHIYEMEDMGEYIYINPGSISLPKNNNKNSYIIYEDNVFILKDLEQNIIKTFELK